MTSHETPSKLAVTILGMMMMAATAAFLFAEPASVETSTAAAAEAPAAQTQPAPPVDVKPAAAPSGTADFIGAETCLSCHQNQEHFKESLHARAFAQAKGIEFSKSCETCHGPGSLHAAAAGDRSNPGFATIKNPKTQSAAALSKTCLECHEGGAHMNWTGSPHERRNVSCVACHSVHDPKEPKTLLVQPKVHQLCATCHQDVAAKVKRNAHMPIEEGKMSCTSCHNPHGSPAPKMIKADSVNDNCYSCHADKRGPFVYEHPPVRENCINCHDAHGSHNDKMLNTRLPFLCQRCHDGQRHPATPYDLTSINANHNKITASSCVNCHSNIHGSNHPSGKYFTR